MIYNSGQLPLLLYTFHFGVHTPYNMKCILQIRYDLGKEDLLVCIFLLQHNIFLNTLNTFHFTFLSSLDLYLFLLK